MSTTLSAETEAAPPPPPERMSKRDRRWWIALACVFFGSFAVLLWMGLQIQESKPPIPTKVVDASGQVLVSGDDVTHSKPHPEPYLRGAELLGVAIADCVAIEDSAPGLASAVVARVVPQRIS